MMDLVSKRLASREEGQTMAEYAVILGVITIAVVVIFGSLSAAISTPGDRHRHPARLFPWAWGSRSHGSPAALACGGITCPLRPESPARRWRSTRSR